MKLAPPCETYLILCKRAVVTPGHILPPWNNSLPVIAALQVPISLVTNLLLFRLYKSTSCQENSAMAKTWPDTGSRIPLVLNSNSARFRAGTFTGSSDRHKLREHQKHLLPRPHSIFPKTMNRVIPNKYLCHDNTSCQALQPVRSSANSVSDVNAKGSAQTENDRSPGTFAHEYTWNNVLPAVCEIAAAPSAMTLPW